MSQAYAAISEAVQAGHQAYLVCPLIDPSDSEEELEDVPEAVLIGEAAYGHAHIEIHMARTVVFAVRIIRRRRVTPSHSAGSNLLLRLLE